MLNFEDFEEKTISRKELFKGNVIEVVIDDVQLPNGDIGKRELVFHSGAVAIIPITKDNKMVMVKQFRKSLEKVILEIPAGKIDIGEVNPIKTAERELEEETGFRAERLEPIHSMYLSPGFANEILHIFYADGLVKVDNPLPQDVDEFLELHTLTLKEAKNEIATGLICDAKTIYAVQYWELRQLKEKIKEDAL